MSFRALSAFVVCVFALTWGSLARGQALGIDAVPLLGPGAPAGDRWQSSLVRLENKTDQQIEGHVEVISTLGYGADAMEFPSRAPFAIAPKARVTLQLPTHGFKVGPPELKLRAVDKKGVEIASAEVPAPTSVEPLLFDLTMPSRIGPGLRGARIAVQYTTPMRGTYGSPTIAVSSPQVNAATGEPVLPDRAAGYAPVSLLLAKSKDLTSLQGAELEAVVNWVLGGGALAVVLSRPEDLRSGLITALVGGAFTEGAAPAELRQSRSFVVPTDPYGSGSSLPRSGTKDLTPAQATSDKLRGFTGGNLHATPWGASASYGLGEVHLLAFDATTDPYVSDEWVQLTIVDLVRHAWDRQITVALPHGQKALDSSGNDEVRKELDPNENTRWAIVVSLLVLILYSMLAGPLNFYLASKAGKPLRALRHLPLWALGCMAIILLLGTLAKGVTGQARHLSLIEAGAGMGHGSITRFRGFYSPAAEQLLIRATAPGNVLDVAGDATETQRELVVDRDGARLEKLQARPWQTVVVREDGFTSLGGGVSIVGKTGDIEVKNRTAHDLIAAILWQPKGDSVYFSRIEDGGTVLASKGTVLGKKVGITRYFGSLVARDLGAEDFTDTLEKDAKGAGAAWLALERVVERGDWWPDDVPVLIAQIEGGEGKTSDSGLRVQSDRVLLRVVGFGGLP
jgi:hypothetical protein